MRSQVFIQTLKYKSSVKKDPYFRRLSAEGYALQVNVRGASHSEIDSKSQLDEEEKDPVSMGVYERIKNFFTFSTANLAEIKAKEDQKRKKEEKEKAAMLRTASTSEQAFQNALNATRTESTQQLSSNLA